MPTPDSSPVAPDTLTTHLHRSGALPVGSRVVTVAAEPMPAGYLADTTRLRLGYSGGADGAAAAAGAPRTLVVKRPAVDGLPRGVGQSMGMYAREVRFYRELAAGSDVRTPRCYLAELDDRSGDFTLLLEDVAGAEVHEQDAPCPEPDLLLALDQAAGLHASHWDDPRLAGTAWLIHLTPAGAKPWHELFQYAWPTFLARDGVTLPAELARLGDALAGGDVTTWIGGYDGPWTLTHADFHLDNLLFVAAGGGQREVAVIDWQLAMHASPLVDVAFLLGRLPSPQRRQVEQPMLAAYHQRLRARGVRGYDWAACREDYDRWLWFGALSAVIASVAYPLTDDQVPRVVEKVSRFLTQAVDHDSVRFLH